MRPRWSIATSRKPHEERSRIASSSMALSMSIRCRRFISPVSTSKRARWASSLLALVAFVDDAHDAMGAPRLAVRAGEPASGVLEPQHTARRRLQRVLHLIGHARAVVGRARTHHGIGARHSARGIDERGEALAAGQGSGIGNAEQLRSIGAPGQAVAVDLPDVGRLADRSQNVMGRNAPATGRARHGRSGRIAGGTRLVPVGMAGRREADIRIGHNRLTGEGMPRKGPQTAANRPPTYGEPLNYSEIPAPDSNQIASAGARRAIRHAACELSP